MAQGLSVMTLGGKVSSVMEKNKFLSKLIPLIVNTGIVGLLYNAERRKVFRDEYLDHIHEFEKVEALLADELSRKTFRAVTEYRKTSRKEFLKGIPVYPQYFQKDIFGPAENEVFVDGGAYTGDTIESYVKDFGGGLTWKKVYAWEPEAEKLSELKQTAQKYRNIEIIPYGLWDKKTVLNFRSGRDISSSIGETGNIRVPVDTIDNICAGDKVTLIKMDIEGSEQEALRGAETIIKRDKPRLAICIYHKPEDLYKIPLMIKKMVPEYKLFVRHHSESWAETVLYATL